MYFIFEKKGDLYIASSKNDKLNESRRISKPGWVNTKSNIDKTLVVPLKNGKFKEIKFVNNKKKLKAYEMLNSLVFNKNNISL